MTGSPHPAAARTPTSPPGSGRSPTVLRSALLLGLLTTACRESSDPPGIRRADLVLPCEQQGYPCTWNQVDSAIVTRTTQLADIAARYSLAAPSLDSIAALLAGVPAMAEVIIDGSGVRFRLEGGRPAWVFLPDELDHHRPPEGGLRPDFDDSARRNPAIGAVPTRGSLARFASGVGRRLAPPPLHAARPQQGQRVAGEPGEGKKALILSPFDFEWARNSNWTSLGADFARQTRMIRDYNVRESEGAEVTYHGDLSELGDNPARLPGDQLTLGGAPLLSGQVAFEDFLGWDERKLNLIVVATHGSAVSCFREVPRGGAAARPEREQNLPPPGKDRMCPLIYAGRAKQQSYGNYLGVEIYAGATWHWDQSDAPGGTDWRDARPELSQADAGHCAAQVAAGAEKPTTPSGAACGSPKWEHDYPYLVLWWPFFMTQYPAGLNNTIVFFGACHSGINMVLPEMLAIPGNEAVTVFGFDESVNAGDAWQVISTMLDLIDGGYHSQALIDSLKKLDRTNHLVGRTMDPRHAVAPARPAEILDRRTHATHGRDVVLLVDPDSGEELSHGGAVTVLGAPGDGKRDSLRLRARIIGVAPNDPIDDVRLFVGPKDEGGGDPYRPERQVEHGVFEFDGDLQLGRDHREGETVDLEIRAELPDGGESRWVYRDIRLGGSFWTLTIGGPRGGTWSGARTEASYPFLVYSPHMPVSELRRWGFGLTDLVLNSDPGDRQNVVITLHLDRREPGAGIHEAGTYRLRPGSEVVFEADRLVRGDFANAVTTRSHRQYVSGDGMAHGGDLPLPPPATVRIDRIDHDWVSGRVDGTFWTLRGDGSMHDVVPVRLEFRARRCLAVRRDSCVALPDSLR